MPAYRLPAMTKVLHLEKRFVSVHMGILFQPFQKQSCITNAVVGLFPYSMQPTGIQEQPGAHEPL